MKKEEIKRQLVKIVKGFVHNQFVEPIKTDEITTLIDNLTEITELDIIYHDLTGDYMPIELQKEYYFIILNSSVVQLTSLLFEDEGE